MFVWKSQSRQNNTLFFLLCLFAFELMWLWREQTNEMKTIQLLYNVLCRWLFFAFDPEQPSKQYSASDAPHSTWLFALLCLLLLNFICFELDRGCWHVTCVCLRDFRFKILFRTFECLVTDDTRLTRFTYTHVPMRTHLYKQIFGFASFHLINRQLHSHPAPSGLPLFVCTKNHCLNSRRHFDLCSYFEHNTQLN